MFESSVIYNCFQTAYRVEGGTLMFESSVIYNCFQTDYTSLIRTFSV